jgi:hypothetical protein
MGERISLFQNCQFGDSLFAMKSILLLLLFTLTANAASLTNLAYVALGWDRSADDQITNGVTYRIYAGTNMVGTNINSLTNFNALGNTNITITNLPPATWFFTASALQGGIESDFSNIAVVTVPKNKPRPPGKFATMYLEMTLDLTNYTDVGHFRAKIYIPN